VVFSLGKNQFVLASVGAVIATALRTNVFFSLDGVGMRFVD
jgi:hypothetical protein